MSKDGWKFPITFSKGRGSEWVHPRAKIHYFRHNETLCKKWSQWDNYDSFEYSLVKELADKRVCKECWKKYKEELANATKYNKSISIKIWSKES